MTNFNPVIRFQFFARVSALTLLAALSAAASEKTKADLSRLVVVGDSLSAGFQNGSLLDVQQVNGYASLVAHQAGVPLTLPLIAAPGIPNVLTLVSPGPPPVIVPATGTSTGRVNPTVQPTNLAVPGARVQDALLTRPLFTFNNITDFVLGFPGFFATPKLSRSQVEWAEHLAPTTILIWIGNNDALNVLFTGTPATLTPVADFKAAYEDVTNRLAATGAKLVIANIPDVTAVPFLTSAEKVAALTGLPLAVVGPILGIGPGDFVTLDSFPTILAILGRSVAGPLPGNLVLDAGEISIIRSRVDVYNNIIATQAQMLGAALVDTHALLSRIQSKGFEVDDQRLTTDFLGGIFSLDGIHPTNTGYAIVANAFIKALNRSFDTDIPEVSVEKIMSTDPLVPAETERPESALGHVSHDAVRALRSVILN